MCWSVWSGIMKRLSAAAWLLFIAVLQRTAPLVDTRGLSSSSQLNSEVLGGISTYYFLIQGVKESWIRGSNPAKLWHQSGEPLNQLEAGSAWFDWQLQEWRGDGSTHWPITAAGSESLLGNLRGPCKSTVLLLVTVFFFFPITQIKPQSILLQTTTFYLYVSQGLDF